MSAAAPITIAVVLPPREGFGPRRARGIGITARYFARSSPSFSTVVHVGAQDGPGFLDVTSRPVNAPWYVPAPYRTRYMIGLTRALRTLNPRIIEVHGEPGIALRLQRSFPAIPVVLVLYDEPSASPEARTPQVRARLFSGLARVVMLSQWLRERYLEGIDPPARPPEVVPPAVDMANLPHSVSGLDAAGIPMSRRRTRLLLFVGRLTPERGADTFVRICIAAMPSLPGWRAEIIGASDYNPASPETPFIEVLKATAEPASIALMGYRDHPDVLSAMARSAIVVIPGGRADPSGRVALEAMASGAAVVCSPTGALPEVCGDVAVFVPSADPQDFAAAVQALGQDPRRLATLGEAGRRRALAFDLPRIGGIIDALRLRVVAEGPPRP